MIPVLETFEGPWMLERQIDDRRTGQPGRFTGEATFACHPKGLTYLEKGTLSLGTADPLYATRRYHWSHGEGNVIDVSFDDGRLFHRFEPAARVEATHWCDPDTYHVTYDFSLWPRWSATWTVTGPAKDYTMISEYARPVRRG